MLLIPFPGSGEEQDSLGLLDQQWSFSRIECHVCADMLFSHLRDPKEIKPNLLTEYLSLIYLLVHPMLDCDSSPELVEVKEFVEQKTSRSLGIIDCHGGVKADGWFIQDRDNQVSARETLQALDGKYSCIICLACNPAGEVVELKHSALLFYSGFAPMYFTDHSDSEKRIDGQLFYKLPGKLPVKVNKNSEKSFRRLLIQQV